MRSRHNLGFTTFAAVVAFGALATLTAQAINNSDTGPASSPGLPNVASVTAVASPTASYFLELLPDHSAYTDPAGQLHVVGEVHSWSSESTQVKVLVDVLDQFNRAMDDGAGWVSNLLPNSTGCFDVILPVAPPGWITYTFASPVGEPHLTEFGPLDAMKVSSQLMPDGEYRVVGRVQNKIGVRVTDVTIYVTLYDRDGRVIGCSLARPNNSALEGGQGAYFVAHFKDTDYSRVVASSYRAYAIPVPQVQTPIPTAAPLSTTSPALTQAP